MVRVESPQEPRQHAGQTLDKSKITCQMFFSTAFLSVAGTARYVSPPSSHRKVIALFRETIGLDLTYSLFKLPIHRRQEADVSSRASLVGLATDPKELEMSSATRKLKNKFATSVFGKATGIYVALASSQIFAQEGLEVADVEAHEELAHGFINLCKEAFSGGHGSQAAFKELMGSYIAPAFLAMAVGWISFIIASAIGRYIGGMVAKKVDLTLGKFLTKAIRNLIMLVVAMGTMSYLGVDVTGLAAVLAAISFAVGMALQGTLGNFASGVMLLLFRPFKVDDYIVLADTQGTVEEIDLFTTRINTLDNRHVIVPNGEIFGSKLENYSRNELRRVDVAVGAAYDADLDQTRQALERAVMSISESVVSPPPQVYLDALGASSVDWQLRVWCEPADYWGVREQLTEAAKRQLDLANISIPFPQLDVNLVQQMAAQSQPIQIRRAA